MKVKPEKYPAMSLSSMLMLIKTFWFIPATQNKPNKSISLVKSKRNESHSFSYTFGSNNNNNPFK